MEIPNLREVESTHEIMHTLAQMKGLGKSLTLWQNLEQGRLTCRSRLTKIDKSTGSLNFEPIKGQFKFFSTLPLYLFSSRNFILLKTKFIFNSNFKVTTEIPGNMMAQEWREFERMKFDLSNEASWIRFNMDDLKHVGMNYYKNKLLDIGHGGFSVLLSGYDVRKFSVGSKLSVHNLNKNNPLNLIQAEVKNISPLKNFSRPGEWYRLGVQFNKETAALDVLDNK